MKRIGTYAGGRRIIIAALTAALAMAATQSPAKPALDAKAIIAKDPGAGKLIVTVPFIEQKDFNCGPASVAMVLRYHGVDADAAAIAREFETKNVAGTFTVDLLIAASERGMDAHWVEGSMAALKKEINQGRPVIVFLNLAINPLPRRHFAVAVGYLRYDQKDYVVLHSGDTPFLMVPLEKFSVQWKRTGNMMMTVAPKPASVPEPAQSPEPPPPPPPSESKPSGGHG
jgi:ABC-type bacteriocin/lantibiotic exporter with double-glycine peptidase domain